MPMDSRLDAPAAGGAAGALRPLPPPGLGRGALLSLLVHAGLLAALAFAVSWRSHAPQVVSAELWAAVPQVAAPAAASPPPTPAPTPPPATAVVPPRPAPPPRTAEPPPAKDAQIAIEKARERERQAQIERERLAREKAEREQAERERAEQEKAARAKAERDKAAKAERDAKARAEAQQREQQAQQQEQQRAKEAQARLDQQRAQNLQRMLGQAGATGAPGAAGTAARDAGPSASYAGKLIARVRPNIVLTDPVPGQPAAEVEVRAAPSGTILSRRLVKSSGSKAWDDAVLRALDRTGELPRDEDGRVPPVVIITFTP
jgi:colicin import membrane protein